MAEIEKAQRVSLFGLFAVRTGLEPATSCVTGRHSNQLNYRTLYYFTFFNLSSYN